MNDRKHEEISFNHMGQEVNIIVEGDIPGGVIISSPSELFVRYFSSRTIWAHSLHSPADPASSSREQFILELKAALEHHGWDLNAC